MCKFVLCDICVPAPTPPRLEIEADIQISQDRIPVTVMASSSGMVDPRIFEDLQTKIDEDADVRDQIKAVLQTLERQGRGAQSALSRAHSTSVAHRESFQRSESSS